jgi:hypothetical protein
MYYNNRIRGRYGPDQNHISPLRFAFEGGMGALQFGSERLAQLQDYL